MTSKCHFCVAQPPSTAIPPAPPKPPSTTTPTPFSPSSRRKARRESKKEIKRILRGESEKFPSSEDRISQLVELFVAHTNPNATEEEKTRTHLQLASLPPLCEGCKVNVVKTLEEWRRETGWERNWFEVCIFGLHFSSCLDFLFLPIFMRVSL